jgi:dissimilatory sulfite reductase (desulfoviridin) alpha/beta subunit
MITATENKIEELIDKVGLEDFLTAIEEVCYQKEEHIIANWQDTFLANKWHKVAKMVGMAANQANIYQL